jgi:biopolymer transport protein ExbB
MVPLGVCSLLGLAIIIERTVALRRSAIIDPGVLRLMDQYTGSTSDEEAVVACRKARGPFARIIEEIIKSRHLDHTQIIEGMHATGRNQMSTLERGLTLLEIIAGVSPLLGLLGTVLGMITVFNAITAQGLGNPQVLSEGIAKALVTTVTGLCVAIPALAGHSWFSRRADDLASEMQERATAFIAKLEGLQHHRLTR